MICVACYAILVSCAPSQKPTEFIALDAQIPADLLQPISVPQRALNTNRDLALRILDYREGLDLANERIASIACIVAPDDGTRNCYLKDE